MFLKSITTVALLFVTCSLSASSFAEEPNKALPKGPTALTAVDRAMDGTISLHFDKRPLDEVVLELDRRLSVKVELNDEPIADFGVPANAPVTVDVKEISLASALTIMLGSLDLGWCERNGKLVITTEGDSEEDTEVRYYDVTALIHGKGRNASFTDLMVQIVSCVRPQSWPDGTGPLPIEPYEIGEMRLFAIPQSSLGHREVRLFLDSLRQAKHDDVEGNNYVFQPPKQIEHPNYAVCRALDRQVRLDIPDLPKEARECVRPFGEVVKLLAKAADVNIVIDRRALGEDDMKSRTPIRIAPMQGTLRECLNRVCRASAELKHLEKDDAMFPKQPNRLCWTIANEVVWITTRDEEESMVSARIFDVWDMPPEPTKWVPEKAGGWVVDPRLPHEREKLTLAISKTIAPGAWEDFSASLARYEGSRTIAMIVFARHGVHEQVESFLAALREARRKGAAEAKSPNRTASR